MQGMRVADDRNSGGLDILGRFEQCFELSSRATDRELVLYGVFAHGKYQPAGLFACYCCKIMTLCSLPEPAAKSTLIEL